MRCPGCGREINDKTVQCEFCGSPIKKNTRNKRGNKKLLTKLNVFFGVMGIIGILILISPTIMFYLFHYNVPVNEMNESVSDEYIGQISNGVWYANATVSIGDHMNYLAMETTWYDSSGNVIEKNLAWTKTNLVKGQNYSINTTYTLNNTPSKVKLVFFENPSVVGNDNQSDYQMELSPGCIAWP